MRPLKSLFHIGHGLDHKQPEPSSERFANRQSPIAIDLSKVFASDSIQPLSFRNYDAQTRNCLMWNTGHTLQVNVDTVEPKLQVGGGNLYTWYDLVQFHFHWGATDNEGSEHRIDNRTFPLELHLVHIKSGHTDYMSMNEPDALHVVSVMFELSEEDNPELNTFLSQASRIDIAGQKTTISTPITMTNLLPLDTKPFWRYWGSLTTTPFAEEVVWSILQSPNSVSSQQVLKHTVL